MEKSSPPHQNRLAKLLDITHQHEGAIFVSVIVALIVFRIWLIAGIPKLLLYAPHDDLFFAKAAHYIIHHKWMGPYSQLTLIKGPFYAIFLVFSFLTGLPLQINETIFYVAACIVLFYALSPLIKNQWWRLLVFALLLFTPASLTTYMNIRVYREFVYFSLSLFVTAFSIGLLLRLKEKLSILVLWSIGLGVSTGAFMITREESVWIYPMLFLLLLICLFTLWRGSADRKWIRSIVLILPILIWQIPSQIVSYLNYSYYGFWGVSETLDPDFNRVLNDWARVENNSAWHPAIQISQEARMELYEAVPLLAEMKDTIENEVTSWSNWDDDAMTSKPIWYLEKYSNGGTEISNGHFLWLFRQVVAEKGYYSNGKFPRDFYSQVADQIEEACNNGSLKCSSPRNIPFVGAVDRRHFPIILQMFYEGLLHILKYEYVHLMPLDIRTWPRWPDNLDEYKYFQEFSYDSLYGPGISPGVEDSHQYMVNTRIDIRLKMLGIKENLIKRITDFYNLFTLPLFCIGFVLWILLTALNRFGTRLKFDPLVLGVSSFVFGLFISRLMTLAIVDATTSVSAIAGYSNSLYVFIHIFSFLMMYWMIKYLIDTYQAKRSLS